MLRHGRMCWQLAWSSLAYYWPHTCCFLMGPINTFPTDWISCKLCTHSTNEAVGTVSKMSHSLPLRLFFLFVFLNLLASSVFYSVHTDELPCFLTLSCLLFSHLFLPTLPCPFSFLLLIHPVATSTLPCCWFTTELKDCYCYSCLWLNVPASTSRPARSKLVTEQQPHVLSVLTEGFAI